MFEALSLEGSLNARNTLGGTAPAQVRAQLASTTLVWPDGLKHCGVTFTP